MGDNNTSVEKLCEAMQQMLVQLMEQSQSKSGASENLKIILEPNPVRLSGPGDYFSWARNASLILGAHGLQKYLKEDEKKPGDIVEKEQWEQSQQRVMVWLLSSMEKTVREQVENLQTAAEIWKDIEKQFSGKSNKMQVCRILYEMRHIKQENKSVTEYGGELKKLYRDLEFFRPFKPHDPRDLSLLREWFEPLLVDIFLEGLNPEFHLRSQLIYATPSWPTLDEAISSILEVETRLANQSPAPQASAETRAALSTLTQIQSAGNPRGVQASVARNDFKRKSRVVCEHCKRPGHMKMDCFEIIGYPPGWKQRQHNRFRVGDNREKNQERVHFTSATEESSTSSSAQALEAFKSKLMAASNEGSTEFASSFHAARGAQDREDTWDWNRA
ncbi:unnamed protein product [Alopecurus aequalis]